MSLKEKILKAPSPAKVLIECKKFYEFNEEFQKEVDLNFQNYIDKNPLEIALEIEIAENSFFVHLYNFYLEGSNLKAYNSNLIQLYTAIKIFNYFNTKEN